jgi:heavy metal sensor kinase
MMCNLRSLRFKLSWTIGLAIALVVVCIGLTRYHTISYRAQRSFDLDLQYDAQVFVSHLNFSGQGFEWSSEGLPPTEALAMEELGPYFVITDSAGNVVRPDLNSKYIRSMLERKGLDRVLSQRSGFDLAVAADGTVYRFVSTAVPGKPQFTIHVGRSIDSMSGVLHEYLFVYFYSVPLILTVSIGVGWFLAGRALKPFEEVSKAAQQVTSSNLNMQIATHHDEVEVLRLVQSFNAMVSRLDRSFQQMRKFNADVAHELRTPLAILQGETEVALSSASVPEEIHSVLASNLEELDRLKRLVNDMLTLAEADAGRQLLNKKPVSLRPLLEDLIEQMRMLGTDREITIVLGDFPELMIIADELWMRRALLNLLDNAIKYSKDGGLVRVRVMPDTSVVRISIQDNGIGIEAKDLPHIFDRLFRADPARTRGSGGGAGLGLALVKWIIEAHQGSIDVHSQPDQWTDFVLTLPLHQAARDQKAPATTRTATSQ